MNFPTGHLNVNGNFTGTKLVTDAETQRQQPGNEENGIFEELAAKIETMPKINANKVIHHTAAEIPTQNAGNFQYNHKGHRDQVEIDEERLVAPSSPPNLTTRLPTLASPSFITGNRILAPKVVENKIISLWHNVKYGWNSKLRTNFSKVQPVWLLGKCYHHKLMNNQSLMPNVAQQSLRSPSIASDMMISTSVTSDPDIDTTDPSDSGVAGDEDEQDSHTSQQEVTIVDISENAGVEIVSNETGIWEDETLNGFRADFCSRLWMTYRREFPLMNNSHYTSDCGWGCMLRSGQMLLAQALLSHFLGRGWRYDPYSQITNTYEDNIHKKIIKWFGDSNSKGNPFSIHALVELGLKIGKRPGDWYGPASVSILLRDAVKAASSEIVDFDNIVVYVAKDSTIYVGDIESKCSLPGRTPKQSVPWKRNAELQQLSHSSNITTNNNNNIQQQTHWKSLIILIPVRLGTEKVNPVYSHWLKLSLSSEYCIGIIGGRPKHSLYFVGFQEDKLIYLDPHYCQEVVDVNQENFPLQSFHCDSPRKLKINKMDPSCCVGFYCQTRSDFLNFQESLQPFTQIHTTLPTTTFPAHSNAVQKESCTTSILQEPSQTTDKQYPLFTFSQDRYLHPGTVQRSVTPSFNNTLRNSATNDNNEKDFVLL